MIVLKRAGGIEINPTAKFVVVKPKGKAIPNPTTTTQKMDAHLPVIISLTENLPVVPR